MKESLIDLKDAISKLSAVHLEYRAQALRVHDQAERVWEIRIIPSNAELDWRRSRGHGTLLMYGTARHEDGVIALQRALRAAVSSIPKPKRRTLLNPPHTHIVDHSGMGVAHVLSDQVPWYAEWHWQLKKRHPLEIHVFQICSDETVRWFVRIDSLKLKKTLGEGHGQELIEAFRRAGNAVIKWDEREYKKNFYRGNAGHEKEKRIAKLLNASLDILPPWIFSARMATSAEDARGIDLVLETDVGDIHLQLKSNEEDKAAFEAKPGHEYIPCFVVGKKVNDRSLLADIIYAVSELRDEFQVLAEFEDP